ncbi:MAG: tetratricopeptide repeat protein [Chloroflexales bacterium]|nr:tetratricopeptide repeat protein [Chloroflexales bacterium]
MTQLNLIGHTLGHFEILAELGRGGMAVVYQARQINLDRIVAMKVLPPELTYDANYIARFHQEAKNAAKLEHPHIVPIYEIGSVADNYNPGTQLHFIVMKFIQGRTLKDLLHDEGALPITRIVTLLEQAGKALDYAHRCNVIHRDIKPSNIMVTDHDWVYLTDFGLARGVGKGLRSDLTAAGTVIGTPDYMSPEQAQGSSSIGPPTDIYAVGVVLYELLTGNLPFQSDTPMGMLAARLLQEPRSPRDFCSDLPMEVENVIMRSLARNPETRYPHVADLVAALRQTVDMMIASAPTRSIPTTQGTAGMETIVIKPQAEFPTSSSPPVLPASDAAPATPEPHLAPPSPVLRKTPPTPPPLPTPSASSAVPANQPGTAGIPQGLLVGVGLATMLIVFMCVGLVILTNRETSPAVIATTLTPSTQGTEFDIFLETGDQALAQEQGLTDAITAYQQALTLQPNSMSALSKLALAYSLRGNWKRTEEQARALIDVAETKSDAAFGHALLAGALSALESNDAARIEAENAIESNPQLALAQGMYAKALANLAIVQNDVQLMEQALAAAQDAVDKLGAESPLEQALVYSAVGDVYQTHSRLTSDQDAHDQAHDAFRQAIELQEQIGLFHAHLGYLYLHNEDYKQARKKFNDAIDRDPDFIHAQTGIGWSYYHERNYVPALNAFDATLTIDASNHEPYYGKGRVAMLQRQYDEAVVQFTEAIKHNAQNATLYAWLGEALLFQGYHSADEATKAEFYNKASDAYHTAIGINDRLALAHTGLGWVFQYQGNYAASVEEFGKSLAVDPDQNEAQNGLGWSLYTLKRYAEAETHFKRAIELDPAYENAFYGLGRSLEQLGRPNEARTAYEQALEINPAFEDALKALEGLK